MMLRMEDMLMAKAECMDYAANSLFISNADAMLKSSPRELLNRLVCSFLERVPLQNITLLSVPGGRRRRPTWDAVRTNILNGLGGICYELNMFMYALLRGLGYRVHLAFTNGTRPNNHLMTIVRDVSCVGDIFLVDAGSGFPSFQAIDLNFERESPEYHHSFLRYKFIKKDGRVIRLHRSRDSNTWKRYCDFRLSESPVDEVNRRFDEIFEDLSTTTCHKTLRCAMFPGQKACAVRNNVLLLEIEKGTLEESTVDRDEDLMATICQRFAVFHNQQKLVETAIIEWRKVENEMP